MLEFELGRIHKGDLRMAKKRFQAEQFIGKLREAEAEPAFRFPFSVTVISADMAVLRKK
jgi:hypothetical protein